MRESKYQANLIKRIKNRFPNCIVMKTDPDYIQGIPDLLILHENHWAALECKRSERAPKRPNQEYYVSVMDEMSFASFIYPENEEDVLNAIQQTFGNQRNPCGIQSQSERLAKI